MAGDTTEGMTEGPTVLLPDARSASSFTAVDQVSPIPLPDLSEGELIADRYRVTGMLGRGGFGEVYEVADQQRSGHLLALKMHRFHGTSTALDAIKGEFALLSNLTHPNLAQVFDFGYVGDDVAFFTQEVVAGCPLGRAGIDLTTREGLPFLAQLCRALDYLHARGLLHRDVKPSNIIVDVEAGHLALLDFGISRALGQVEREQLIGTYAYLSPEAIGGHPVDARSDLYSLGVTLYALAARRVPFTGSGSKMLAGHLNDEAPRLDPDHAPRAVADVVHRLLEKAPGARYASAGEVLEAAFAAHGLEAPAEDGETLASYVLSGSFVGKQDVLDRLTEGGASGSASRPPALLVGAAGTGKSRILREVRHRTQLAGQSWLVVEGRRGDDDKTILGAIARAVITPEVAARLGEEDRIELSRGMPSLRRRGERIAIAVDPRRARAARLEALGRAIAIRFLHRPGFLVIEDLHWGSEAIVPALGALHEAMGRATAMCFLLCTSRPGSMADALVDQLGADRVTVPPLSPRESRALVESIFGEAKLLAGTELGRTLDAGEHSALFVQESLRLAVELRELLRSKGGWSLATNISARPLSEVLDARIRGLSDEARHLAVATAMLEEPASAGEIAAASGAGLSKVAPSLRELVRAGIVEDRRNARGHPVYAMHDRFIDVVIGALLPPARREAHRRTGMYLAKRGRRDPQILARAAYHLVAAQIGADARLLYERAGRLADDHGRPDHALALMRQGAAAGPIRGVRGLPTALERHDLAVKAGIAEAADETLVVLEGLRRKSDPKDRVEIDLRRANMAAMRGEESRARRLGKRALAAARKLGDPRLEQALLLATSQVQFVTGAIESAAEGFEAATKVAEARGDRLGLAEANLGASLAFLHLGRSTRAENQAQRAAKAARGGAGTELRSEALRQLGNVARERGDNRRAARFYRQAVKAARATGAIVGEAKALNNLGTVAQWLGRVEEATEAFTRSRELKVRAGAQASVHVTDINLGALFVATGRLAEGRTTLRHVVAADDASELVTAIARSNLGDLNALENRLEEAVSCYRLTLAFARDRGFAAQQSHVLSGLLRVLTMRGGAQDLDEAGELLDELDALRNAELAESERRYHAGRAAWLDARGETEEALAEARLAVILSDRETRFSDVFGTPLDATWLSAIMLSRLGRARAAQRALQVSRKALAKLVAQVGDMSAQRVFLYDHPLHRAIDLGRLDLTPGWTWRRDN
ncbi:MAG: hypothetical protein DRJ42_08270 [Deltaproteobacteria bacterium]|nr:MAG: hypothetical protein DRJ42_08270 [Deltaproteobacteria bacterium]